MWQCFHLSFKACTKGYVVNSCLANPDNEAVSHSATCSTNFLRASWGAVYAREQQNHINTSKLVTCNWQQLAEN